MLGAILAALALAQTMDKGLKAVDAPDWLRVYGLGPVGAYGVWQDKETAEANTEAEREAKLQPYRRSRFMPPPPGAEDPMARYAPQNRPPQSGGSPDIMAYLRKYIR